MNNIMSFFRERPSVPIQKLEESDFLVLDVLREKTNKFNGSESIKIFVVFHLILSQNVFMGSSVYDENNIRKGGTLIHL